MGKKSIDKKKKLGYDWNISHNKPEENKYMPKVEPILNPQIEVSKGLTENTDFYTSKGMVITNNSITDYDSFGVKHNLPKSKLDISHTVVKPNNNINYTSNSIQVTKQIDESSKINLTVHQERSINNHKIYNTGTSIGFKKECEIFIIDKLVYDNEILNHPTLYKTFIEKHGVSHLNSLLELGECFITAEEKDCLRNLCNTDNALESLELLMGCNDVDAIIE